MFICWKWFTQLSNNDVFSSVTMPMWKPSYMIKKLFKSKHLWMVFHSCWFLDVFVLSSTQFLHNKSYSYWYLYFNTQVIKFVILVTLNAVAFSANHSFWLWVFHSSAVLINYLASIPSNKSHISSYSVCNFIGHIIIHEVSQYCMECVLTLFYLKFLLSIYCSSQNYSGNIVKNTGKPLPELSAWQLFCN